MTPRAKRPSRAAPARQAPGRAWLWDIAEGAIADAFAAHPEYLTDAGRRSAIESAVKRIVGRLHAAVTHEAQKGRPVEGAPAAVALRQHVAGVGAREPDPTCRCCGRLATTIHRMNGSIGRYKRRINELEAQIARIEGPR